MKDKKAIPAKQSKSVQEEQKMRVLANYFIDRALEEWSKANKLNLNKVSNNNILIMEHQKENLEHE